MPFQFDSALGANKSAVTKTSVGAIGGGVGLRVVLDEGVMPSKSHVLRALQTVEQRIVEDTWPPT